MHAAFQLPFSGRCSRQVYGTVTSLKECGSVLNSRLWGVSIAWRQKERLWSKLCLWQIGDNVTCPWEICGDAIHIPRSIQPPTVFQYNIITWLVSSHLSLSLSKGVWGVMGRRKVRQTDDRLSLFSLPIIPCSRRALRAKTTGDKSVSSLRSIMRCILLGTIFTSRPYLHLG